MSNEERAFPDGDAKESAMGRLKAEHLEGRINSFRGKTRKANAKADQLSELTSQAIRSQQDTTAQANDAVGN